MVFGAQHLARPKHKQHCNQSPANPMAKPNKGNETQNILFKPRPGPVDQNLDPEIVKKIPKSKSKSDKTLGPTATFSQ